jgi:hypothetical protein
MLLNVARRRMHIVLPCALGLLTALPAAAGTLAGTVRNGTTGAAVPGVDVVLIQLQGGMEPLATTKSDAQGRFQFDHPGIARSPLLLRVVYAGVNYHQNVPPGAQTTNVEVFEATAAPGSFQVATRLVALQPAPGQAGPALLVAEEFTLHNHTKPPASFFKPDGSFEFELPESGELAQVSAWGPSGMPTVQGTIEKGRRRHAVAFPLRPGENGVRISYQVPYPANQATLRLASPYAAQRVLVVAPPTMQVAGAGFQPAGSEQGWNVFARDAVAAGAVLELNVSGTAPPPQEAAGGPPGSGPDASQIRLAPMRLDGLKWVLLGGFGALFALGVFFLLRKPAVAPVHSEPVSRPARPSNGGSEAVARLTAEAESASPPESWRAEQSLDGIKELLFKLELRRQAGTITEDEYARERARAEKLLRDYLR